MRPTVTDSDTSSVSPADAETSSKLSTLVVGLFVVISSNLQNLGRSQLSSRRLFTKLNSQPLEPAASDTIGYVAFGRASIKVVRVTAQFIVAAMADVSVFWNHTMCKPIDSDVGRHRRPASIPAKLRVSCANRLLPKPTIIFITDVDFGPESEGGGYRTSHVRFDVIHTPMFVNYTT